MKRDSLYSLRTSSGRTSNKHEAIVAEALESDGWEVYRNGWPDFLAVKDGQVRFVEVKPSLISRLSQRQAKVAKHLRALGPVEVVTTVEGAVVACDGNQRGGRPKSNT